RPLAVLQHADHAGPTDAGGDLEAELAQLVGHLRRRLLLLRRQLRVLVQIRVDRIEVRPDLVEARDRREHENGDQHRHSLKSLSCSRSAFLRNLPAAVRGIAWRKMNASGSQNFANSGSRYSRSSSGVAFAPSRSTTHATGRSSHFGCLTATTAASFTAGWPISAFSRSTELIHSPPLLIRSFDRSVMRT